MTVEQVGDFLLWSPVINIGLLLWWLLLFSLAHDWRQVVPAVGVEQLPGNCVSSQDRD